MALPEVEAVHVVDGRLTAFDLEDDAGGSDRLVIVGAGVSRLPATFATLLVRFFFAAILEPSTDSRMTPIGLELRRLSCAGETAPTVSIVRIATWNLERKRPTTPTGRSAVDYLEAVEPGVAVLTEARVDHLGHGWDHASAGSSGLPHLSDDERKVVIASRAPLSDVETSACDGSVPGRFVAASVDFPSGPVRIVGVCIPWSHSRVRSGVARAWDDHRGYLDSLATFVSALSPSEKVIVAGDFNQRIPRTRQPRDVAERLAGILDGFTIPTAGKVMGVDRALIDHIAVRGLTVESVEGWPNNAGGIRMSDHDGVAVEFGPESPIERHEVG